MVISWLFFGDVLLLGLPRGIMNSSELSHNFHGDTVLVYIYIYIYMFISSSISRDWIGVFLHGSNDSAFPKFISLV